MKNNIKSICFTFLSIVFFYLIISFIQLNLNFFTWDIFYRIILSFVIIYRVFVKNYLQKEIREWGGEDRWEGLVQENGYLTEMNKKLQEELEYYRCEIRNYIKDMERK